MKGKRAELVVNLILERGSITTDELESEFRYDHAPRAVRDARERGAPIKTEYYRNDQGRRRARYMFDVSSATPASGAGRRVLPKKLKDDLLEASGCRCALCLQEYDSRFLQVDHRVPYEIAPDDKGASLKAEDYMLVCRSCNRAKSWCCEHCPNRIGSRSAAICATCYWANTESYRHIGLRAIRRVEVVWSEDEINEYERLKRQAEACGEPVPDYVKSIIKRHLGET